MHVFQKNESLELNLKNGETYNDGAVVLPEESDKILKFTNRKNQLISLFVFCCDLETSLLQKKIYNEENKNEKVNVPDYFKAQLGFNGEL